MKETKKIRWGILATGVIAHKFGTALRYVEDAEIAAVASRSLDRAQAFAEEFDVPKAYGSYAELAADPEIDIVYIGTPMSSHYQDAMLCLNAGKHVLCEKAVTVNIRELEELRDKAKEKGLFFMEATWMKCMPSLLAAKKWIQEGLIGAIKMIKADFSIFMPYDPNSRYFSMELGGGAILDLGAYTIGFITSFLGFSPKRVTSSANIGPTGVDNDSNIRLEYDGAFGTSVIGYSFETSNPAFIVGEKGTIVFPDLFLCSPEATCYDTDGNEIRKFSEPFGCNGYEYEVVEVQNCLRAGKLESDLVPIEESIAIMKIMDLCREQWKTQN